MSFGSAATAYERYRPGYPDALVEEVLAYAGRPVRTALEIGAGTGKATRAFAGRGFTVTATEPDAAMLAELRRYVPPSVIPCESAFEDLSTTATYDLVLAAASLHWTEPTGRWSRIAALLAPGGTFASFGGPLALVDASLEAAVRAARSAHLVDDEVPSPDGTSPDSERQWPGTELARDARFEDVRQSTIERRLWMAAPEYVGHLSTVSAYLVLSPEVRALVLERVLAALPKRVHLVGDLTLHLARRAGP